MVLKIKLNINNVCLSYLISIQSVDISKFLLSPLCFRLTFFTNTDRMLLSLNFNCCRFKFENLMVVIRGAFRAVKCGEGGGRLAISNFNKSNLRSYRRRISSTTIAIGGNSELRSCRRRWRYGVDIDRDLC